MFRTIPSRRLSIAPRSLSAFSGLRSSSSNAKPQLKPISWQSCTRPQPLIPCFEIVPRPSFSTSPSRLINDAQRKLNLKERNNVLQQRLESNPEKVTTTSSMTPILDPKPKKTAVHNELGDDPDMLRGLKSDFKTVKETFELNEVPKEVLYIGMAGLIPYLGTSLSTLYLAWDINYSQAHGMGYFVSAETAGHLLHILEPLQVGLGATILSFLGAVHWGLEMAEFGGKHPYKRYSLSILAPMLAWPTLLLPMDYALLAQFLGFTGMYFADSIATSKGWAPRWYMTYRFLLTFVVGASIVMTLVGRGQIGDRVSKIPGPASYLQELRDSQWENLRKEEEERRKRVRNEASEIQRVEGKKTAAGADNDSGREGGEGDERKSRSR